MRMRRLMIVMFTVFIMVACKTKNTNAKLLPISSMKLVLWDILKTDEWYTQTSIQDTLHKRLNENFQIYEQVFLIHHISKKQFYDSYKFFETHPDQFKTLIDSVIAVGDRDKVIQKFTPTRLYPN